MTDILERLAACIAGTVTPEERDAITLEACAEIARLRPTDEEVNAIRLGELAYPGLRITDNGKWVDVWATLRGLLARCAIGHQEGREL